MAAMPGSPKGARHFLSLHRELELFRGVGQDVFEIFYINPLMKSSSSISLFLTCVSSALYWGVRIALFSSNKKSAMFNTLSVCDLGRYTLALHESVRWRNLA
jgi:hypothetical protein